MLLAVICARPLLGELDQAFQYIQEFTGFFTPGIVVLFLLGMFWKGATAKGALAAAAGSAVFSLSLKLLWPSLPFIDRVGVVFIACLVLAILVSKLDKSPARPQDDVSVSFSTTTSYNIAALAVTAILCALYISWW
jgi:SSS family solute:Na+ symporter